MSADQRPPERVKQIPTPDSRAGRQLCRSPIESGVEADGVTQQQLCEKVRIDQSTMAQ
ncbi:hypothetical protein [Nocardia asteroides]|uniref:hypothetical protein n=1 Tax=Nocardia asteroides TaxID=1824 RepID=UPI0034335B6A